MNCSKCDNNLVSKVETDSKMCVICIPEVLKEAQDKASYIEKLEAQSRILISSLKILDEAREKRLDLEACFEGGKEAFTRDFDIEQDPHAVGSEESTMWRSGWVEAARLKEAEEMRDYIRWDFELWMHVHELAANGCDHEEIRVKSSLAPARSMRFLPELLQEAES